MLARRRPGVGSRAGDGRDARRGASVSAQVRAWGDSEGNFQGDRVVDSAGHDALVHMYGLLRTPVVAGGQRWARHAATRPDQDFFGGFFVSAGVRSRPLGAAWCWLVLDRVPDLGTSFRDFVVVAADSAAHAHESDIAGTRTSAPARLSMSLFLLSCKEEKHVAFAD